MKHARRVALVLALSLLILCLAGCGKMTPEKLAGKMVASTAGRIMTQMDVEMEMDVDFSVEQLGVTMEMGMDMDYRAGMKMSADPFAGYGDVALELSMEVLGQKIDLSETMQMYMLLEDGKLVSYTHADSLDSWDRTEAPDMEQAEGSMDYSFLTDMIPEITLDEEKAMLGDKEVYVIRLTLTGEQMQKLMGDTTALKDALGKVGLAGEVDLSGLAIPAVFYVDAKTYLPVQIEMEVTGMDDVMNSVISSMLGGLGESMNMQMNLDTCRVVVKNISFDPVEVPVLPEEATK